MSGQAVDSTENDDHTTPALVRPCSELHLEGFAVLKMNLTFAGCGFLGIYHLAVAQTLARHGNGFLLNVQKFAGASAGALVASTLAIHGPDEKIFEECVLFCHSLAKQVRKSPLGTLTPRLSLLKPLEAFLEHMVPVDGHQKATGRLYISVTNRSSRRNEVVSEYNTRHELIQYLLASSYIPLVTGTKSVSIDNQRYVDGGLTNNLPRPPGAERTITVSPFAGKQDISPIDRTRSQMYLNIHKQDFQVGVKNIRRGCHAFFPPKRASLERYHRQGEEDTLRFLTKEGFLHHTH